MIHSILIIFSILSTFARAEEISVMACGEYNCTNNAKCDETLLKCICDTQFTGLECETRITENKSQLKNYTYCETIDPCKEEGSKCISINDESENKYDHICLCKSNTLGFPDCNNQLFGLEAVNEQYTDNEQTKAEFSSCKNMNQCSSDVITCIDIPKSFESILKTDYLCLCANGTYGAPNCDKAVLQILNDALFIQKNKTIEEKQIINEINNTLNMEKDGTPSMNKVNKHHHEKEEKSQVDDDDVKCEASYDDVNNEKDDEENNDKRPHRKPHRKPSKHDDDDDDDNDKGEHRRPHRRPHKKPHRKPENDDYEEDNECDEEDDDENDSEIQDDKDKDDECENHKNINNKPNRKPHKKPGKHDIGNDDKCKKPHKKPSKHDDDDDDNDDEDGNDCKKRPHKKPSKHNGDNDDDECDNDDNDKKRPQKRPDRRPHKKPQNHDDDDECENYDRKPHKRPHKRPHRRPHHKPGNNNKDDDNDDECENLDYEIDDEKDSDDDDISEEINEVDLNAGSSNQSEPEKNDNKHNETTNCFQNTQSNDNNAANHHNLDFSNELQFLKDVISRFRDRANLDLLKSKFKDWLRKKFEGLNSESQEE